MGLDKTTQELLEKALTYSDISGKLIQEVVDKVVVDMFFSENPLRQNLSTKKGYGSAYIFNRRLPSASGGQAISDTDTFSEATGTYERVTLPYKIYGTSVKVTRFAQVTGANYIDVLREELSSKIEEFKEWEQKAILWGNYVPEFTDGDKYADGIIKQIINGGNGNYVLLGDTTAGDNLTLAKLDEAIDKCWQDPSIIITSRTGRRILQGLLQAQQRFINTVEIRGGFRVMEYAGLPVLTSTAVPDTIKYNPAGANGQFVEGLTGGATTMFLILNLKDCFIAELERLRTKEIPVPSSQFTQYDIWEYITPVVKNPKLHCVLLGIKVA